VSDTPAVFLDRDGVLLPSVVGSDGVPRPTHTLTILPGVVEGCSILRSMGYRLVIVTNQPDVARGAMARAAVEAMNEQLRRLLSIDDVRACFHDDADNCPCRKPKPGMITDAARDLGIDLTASFLIGDRPGDMEAARRAGCRPIFIDRAYPGSEDVQAEARFDSLLDASLWIQRNAPGPVA
jgi:D-glycero-D-manno-heptose 1,7-bisphosphate phosphatase